MTKQLPLATVLLAASLASAQQATRQADPTPDRDPPAVRPDPAAPGTTERYRQSGGSLLRSGGPVATVVPQRPGGAPASQADRRLAEVSFYAVPSPEPREIRKHELVTVIVREQSEFKSTGSTELEKDARLTAALNEFVRLDLGKFGLEPAIGAVKPRVDLEANASFEGDGAVSRKDSVTARVQAEVVDIKPNGNLVLQARTRVKTDDETALFVLSGTCREEDVSLDNTVLSTQLYDLDLRKEHTGTVRNATRRGWLPRLLDAVNPF